MSKQASLSLVLKEKITLAQLIWAIMETFHQRYADQGIATFPSDQKTWNFLLYELRKELPELVEIIGNLSWDADHPKCDRLGDIFGFISARCAQTPDSRWALWYHDRNRLDEFPNTQKAVIRIIDDKIPDFIEIHPHP